LLSLETPSEVAVHDISVATWIGDDRKADLAQEFRLIAQVGEVINGIKFSDCHGRIDLDRDLDIVKSVSVEQFGPWMASSPRIAVRWHA